MFTSIFESKFSSDVSRKIVAQNRLFLSEQAMFDILKFSCKQQTSALGDGE